MLTKVLVATALSALAVTACSSGQSSSPAPVSSQTDGGEVASSGPACLPNCQGADLAGVVFNKVNLDNANFTGANLTGARFEDLTGRNVNFTSARLNNATFKAVDFGGSDCTGDSMRGWTCPGAANMNGVDMRGATLELANLTGAKFFVNIDGAKFLNSTLDKTYWRVSNEYGVAAVKDASFDGSSLRYVSGEVVAFRNSTMNRTNFSHAALYNWRFGTGSATGASFEDASLDDVWFTDFDLTGASLARATGYIELDRVNMTRANLRDATVRMFENDSNTWTDVTCPDGSVRSSNCR